MDTLELERHDPSHGNRHVFPVEWRIDGIPEGAKALVDDFLNSTFADDPAKIPVILAFIGYALSPDMVWETCLFLLGNGRNGKGTLLSMVAAMFGDAAAEMDLEELATDRFARAELADRRLVNEYPEYLSTATAYSFTSYIRHKSRNAIPSRLQYARPRCPESR